MMVRATRCMVGILLVLAAGTAWAAEIHDAVAKGDLEAVKRILEASPGSVNAPDQRGDSPLHIAAIRGLEAVAAALVEHGADLNAKNPQGMTPVLLGVHGGHLGLVDLLAAKGADLNISHVPLGTPLCRAAFTGRADLVALLLGRGARVNEASPRLLWTPLHWAAKSCKSAEALRLLVAKGADLDARDGTGRTPLHLALGSGAAADAKIQFIRSLLQAGAGVNTAAEDGETPLMAAVTNGYSSVVRDMLDRGAEIRGREKETGRSLLHLAALYGYGEIAGSLISAGADVRALDALGKCPLDYASKYGHKAVADRLRAAGAVQGSGVENPTPLRSLRKKMQAGEAYLWRLRGRGWAVKTSSHLLVFDQEEGGLPPDTPSLNNGWIAADEIKNEKILALYTCYHAEPGTLEFIHGIEDRLRDVTYLHRKADEWRGGRHSVYLEGQETRRFGDVEVTTVEMDDSTYSLGYLVKVDGVTIFYSGFYPESLETQKKEIDFIAGHAGSLDIALLDHRPDWDADNPHHKYAIEKLKPKAVVVVTDAGLDRTVQREVGGKISQTFPGVQVGSAVEAGDRLHYKNARLE